MCAKDMSVRQAHPGDFQDWVQRHLAALTDRFSDLQIAFACPDCKPDQCRHYPRAVMGEYLKAQFDEAVQSAGALGVSVELMPGHEVIDLQHHDGCIALTVRESSTQTVAQCDADGVLLATGHWFEKPEDPFFFTSPWPAAELLTAIPEGETVGVLGSSLSAVEVALTLTSEGRFERQPSGELAFIPPANPRKAVFYSRQGLLPRVRGRTGSRPNRFFTCDEIRRMIAQKPMRLQLSDVFRLLDKELSTAYGTAFNWSAVTAAPADPAQQLRRAIRSAKYGDGPDGELIWQTVLVEIFPVARDLYLNLALDERRRFDRDFTTAFFMHAATQPVLNAEKLLALMTGGFVRVEQLGRDYRLHREPSGRYQFRYRDPLGRVRHADHRYIVNARGQPRSVETDPAELTRNLLRRGGVQLEERRDIDAKSSSGVDAGQAHPADRSTYRTGSVLIDPETHRVLRDKADGAGPTDPPVFAVGAMTRGQMIDASMADGISRSTAAVVDHLMDVLTSA
jgi:uncharacterized NAD(P)/FAD-binding protein YdhS